MGTAEGAAVNSGEECGEKKEETGTGGGMLIRSLPTRIERKVAEKKRKKKNVRTDIAPSLGLQKKKEKTSHDTNNNVCD